MPKQDSSRAELIANFVAALQAHVATTAAPHGQAEVLDQVARGLFGPGAKPAPARRGPGRPRGVAKLKAAFKPKAPKARSSKAKPVAAAKSPSPRASISDEALCRFPGCRNRHGGPRLHKFCREHFDKISVADRETYKKMWKAANAG